MANATFTPYGVKKVGSHHWTWFVGEYDAPRVYSTKREAVMAMEQHITESRGAGIRLEG